MSAETEIHAVIRDSDGQIVGIRRPAANITDPAVVAIAAGLNEEATAKLLRVTEGLTEAAQRFAQASNRDLDAIRAAERERWAAAIQTEQARHALHEAQAVTSAARDIDELADMLVEAALTFAFREGAKHGIEAVGEVVSPAFAVSFTDESLRSLDAAFERFVHGVLASISREQAQVAPAEAEAALPAIVQG